MPSNPRVIARLLAAANVKVVFAESCTAGLASATLARVPGISEHHCGGMVVYRNGTKQAYLDIPAKVLDDPGPVSGDVAKLMAQGVLAKTPEADLAMSVTGHLGPQAPQGMDGLVYVAIAFRKPASVSIQEFHCRRGDSRVARQKWIVEQMLELLANSLISESKIPNPKSKILRYRPTS